MSVLIVDYIIFGRKEIFIDNREYMLNLQVTKATIEKYANIINLFFCSFIERLLNDEIEDVDDFMNQE